MPPREVDVAAFVERTCTAAGVPVEVTGTDALNQIGVILAERVTTPGPTPGAVAQEIPEAATSSKQKGYARERRAA